MLHNKPIFNRTLRYTLAALVTLLAAIVAFPSSVAPTPTQAQTTPRTAFVQLFEWKWTDIANECEQWLGPKGFSAVQVSPPNEHMVMSGGSTPNPWWERYQPVSYSISKSRSGTAAQFQDMVTRCRNVGVGIYVDAIINHTAAGSGVGSDGHTYSFPNFSQFPYSSTDFHNQCDINYGAQDGGTSIRYCWLGGALPDLKTESAYVRGKILDYMNAMVAIGVTGFRIDAAKHMEPADMSYFASNVNNLRSDWYGANQRPYFYQEVIYGAGEAVQPDQYVFASLPQLDVEEFRYGAKLGGKFRGDNGQKLSELSTFGSSWGMLGSDAAVAFTDNHDNQRGHGSGYWGADGRIGGIVTFHYDSSLYALANVFQLAWPYGYPRLMSSYDWPRNIQNGKDVNDWVGPPSDGSGNTNTVTCFSGGWVCEHRWLAIANMVGFRNNVNSVWTVNNWWSNNNNQIAFSRGDKGFVAINREGSALSRTFTTGMAAGTYCNVIVGNLNAAGNGCTGASITVAADGTASITVPSMSAVAIHVGAKVGGTVTPTHTPTSTPTGPTPTKTNTPTVTPTPTGAIIKVHYKGWANPNIYAWVGTNTELRGAWPGTAMTAETNGWYVNTITGQTSVNLIFNSGANQTANLSRTTGEWWYMNGVWTASNPEGGTITPTFTPTPTATNTPTATPTATGGTCTIPVNFNSNTTTVMGENVYVVGSIPALGSWNTASAIALSSATYPVWKATINIPCSTAVQYKYIKKNGATVTWELNGQANRSFTTGTTGTITRNDTWNVWSAREDNVAPVATPEPEMFDAIGLPTN